MKLKVIYLIMSISLISNLVLFDTLAKSESDLRLAKEIVVDLNKDYINLQYEHVSLVNSSRLIRELKDIP